MDYNEYNSNGNKKKFNLSNMMNDKQQRSIVVLVFYLLLFLILIIVIRMNINSTSKNKEVTNNEIIENTENNSESVEKTNIDLTNMFSFIDLNNYSFSYDINMNNNISKIEGKRYNDKYSFTMNNNGYTLFFNGTSNYIRSKETVDGEYKLTGFPYVLVNIFDTNVLKKIVNGSKLNNDIYEINNETLGKIVGYDKLDNKDGINTIELIKNNNIITGINMNLTSSISSYMKDNMEAIIKIKYSEFGLIDDFKIE